MPKLPPCPRFDTDPEGWRAYHRAYRELNRVSLLAKKRQYTDRIRLEGIAALGGRCECCGEEDEPFLTLEHRAEVPRFTNGKRITGKGAWAIARRDDYDPDLYGLLCFNCNCAKGAYGSCPHTW
jgi:hypothetical protein